jgi:hypothetical protein
MAKISAEDQRKMEGLEEAKRKWDHVYSLVEQAAAGGARRPDPVYVGQIGRAAKGVARTLNECGFPVIGQAADELQMILRRGSAPIRNARDRTATVRAAIDQAYRTTRAEAQKIKPTEEEG